MVGRRSAGESGRCRDRGTVSILEIGNEHLDRVGLSPALAPFVRPGRHTRLLLSTGVSRGLITRPYIAAVETEGRVYKREGELLRCLGGALGYTALVLPLVRLWWPLVPVLAAGIILYYGKSYRDFLRF